MQLFQKYLVVFFKTLLFCTFIAATTSQNAAASGFEVGNGGDVVNCAAQSANLPAGLYSLDYLVSSAAAGSFRERLQQSFEEYVSETEALLHDKLPELATDFSIFRENFLNTEDYTRAHVWEPVAYKLKDLKDEGLIETLPSGCINASTGLPELIQAVIRTRRNTSGSSSSQRIYKFVPEVLNEIKEQAPLQLSYLFMHEWLWDHSHIVERNRRLVAYFHSQLFAEQSREEALDQLKGMGFAVPHLPAEGSERTRCGDESLTNEDIRRAYPRSSLSEPLGSVQVTTFYREHCADAVEICNRGWSALPEILPPVFRSNVRSYLWFQNSNLDRPLKVINPEAIRRGEFEPRPDDALVSCALPRNSDSETLSSPISCRLHPKAFQLLAGKTVRFFGEFTQHCLSLESNTLISVESNDGNEELISNELELRLLIQGTIEWKQ